MEVCTWETSHRQGGNAVSLANSISIYDLCKIHKLRRDQIKIEEKAYKWKWNWKLLNSGLWIMSAHGPSPTLTKTIDKAYELQRERSSGELAYGKLELLEWRRNYCTFLVRLLVTPLASLLIFIHLNPWRILISLWKYSLISICISTDLTMWESISKIKWQKKNSLYGSGEKRNGRSKKRKSKRDERFRFTKSKREILLKKKKAKEST